MSHPRGEVPRPRLHARLDEVTRARLAVVVADAGFGKTTLLHQWLPTVTDRRVARPVSRDVPGIAAALVDVLRADDRQGAARLDLVVDAGVDDERALALAGLLCSALSATDALLVVDDAHLLDPATARFTEALVPAGAEWPAHPAGRTDLAAFLDGAAAGRPPDGHRPRLRRRRAVGAARRPAR